MRKSPKAAAFGPSCSVNTVSIPVSTQILQTAAALLLGLGLGFLYDAFRVIRTKCGSVIIAALCDISFWVLAGSALFIMGMGPGRGELRIYYMLVSLAGAGLYFLFFGFFARKLIRCCLRAVAKFFAVLSIPFKKLEKILKKIGFFFKSIFSRLKKWFTIIRKNATGTHRRKNAASKPHLEEITYEVETRRYYN